MGRQSLLNKKTCSCIPTGRGIGLKNRTVLVRIQSGVPMSRDTQAEREQLAKLSGRVTGAGVRISLPRPYDNTEWCSGKHVWLITKRSGVRIPSP